MFYHCSADHGLLLSVPTEDGGSVKSRVMQVSGPEAFRCKRDTESLWTLHRKASLARCCLGDSELLGSDLQLLTFGRSLERRVCSQLLHDFVLLILRHLQRLLRRCVCVALAFLWRLRSLIDVLLCRWDLLSLVNLRLIRLRLFRVALLHISLLLLRRHLCTENL
ncbi:hypothetical protein MARPO_0085s0022 [Marchantia polymorpha]|uniref:Uncharacterized protein n=1 Tax=Marchantia polymorpha TaxID=3197 RepID=A0A2R6WIZ2_MARPO|nr:hypothetical protein MARPO_0085s0022 [Marchantia polymorpha]|eukprot:PTQ33799.1 hypothetical protein MARPO_0085s0022 [Marchantia polymorpha]